MSQTPYQITLDPQPNGWRWQVVGEQSVCAEGVAPSQRSADADSAMVAELLAVLDRASRRHRPV